MFTRNEKANRIDMSNKPTWGIFVMILLFSANYMSASNNRKKKSYFCRKLTIASKNTVHRSNSCIKLVIVSTSSNYESPVTPKWLCAKSLYVLDKLICWFGYSTGYGNAPSLHGTVLGNNFTHESNLHMRPIYLIKLWVPASSGSNSACRRKLIYTSLIWMNVRYISR